MRETKTTVYSSPRLLSDKRTYNDRFTINTVMKAETVIANLEPSLQNALNNEIKLILKVLGHS